MLKKFLTIKGIAEKAGVSPSTVSRALNNHPLISEATKKKISSIARKMGYSPNLFARSLVKKKTFLIGVLVYDLRDWFYADLALAIRDTAEKFGYWVIQGSTYDNLERTHSLINSMRKTGVEGIIFASTFLEDPIVEKLITDHFPLVLANRRLKKDKGDYVITDNTRGAYLAVNHLIHLGFRRIGMMRGPRYFSTSEDRYRGYIDSLKENQLPIEKELILRVQLSKDEGYRVTKKLMNLPDPPKAIFCHDDDTASGAMAALIDLGLKVPRDVALVGFDDVEISSHPLIQLTSVSQDAEKMGRLATEILVERIQGNSSPPRRIVLEPRLVVRQSCGSKESVSRANK